MSTPPSRLSLRQGSGPTRVLHVISSSLREGKRFEDVEDVFADAAFDAVVVETGVAGDFGSFASLDDSDSLLQAA